VRKLGVTQELLALVTGLAHYLKLLIRICLQGALRVEQERHNSSALDQFLEDIGDMGSISDEKSLESSDGQALAANTSDQCIACLKPIEDECAKLHDMRWHISCVTCSNCHRELGLTLEDATWNEKNHSIFCSRCASLDPPRGPGRENCEGGFIHITRLQQYVFLLRVALARLLALLRRSGTLPHTSDDPNLNGYNSREGHRLSGQLDPPLLRSDTRSKSYGGSAEQNPRDSSYENTLNDVRRLRSTRMDKHLSQSIRKARTSRVIDGPEGRSVRPGSSGADGSDPINDRPQIIEERDTNGQSQGLFFGHQDALTLDDIPRIVAAERRKDERPNAYKHFDPPDRASTEPLPKLQNGHQRSVSGANDLDAAGDMAGEPSPNRGDRPGKRYFSELSALEYFVVRHVAVITMQPLLEGHFTLEELLGLIESRKPTFWNKFGKAFKNDGRKGGKKKGIFGVPLDSILERDGAESTDGVGPGTLRIPAIVDDCISSMRKMDLSVEGVFRKNGNIRRLNEAVAQIDKDGCDSFDMSKENVVQVAAILKRYLRELPDPLMTFKLHKLWIASQRIVDEEKRRRVLHLTCCLLPKSHRDCLEVIFEFFKFVAEFHHVGEEEGSKMDEHNLATVIAPNILFTVTKGSIPDDSFLAIEAVYSLIRGNGDFCEVSSLSFIVVRVKLTAFQIPEDLASVLGDSEIFNNESAVTTKEILKRYGNMAANGGPRHQVETTESPFGKSKDGSGRALAPQVTRVDTDPNQQDAWQKETSVRHVQDPSVPYAGNSSNQNTPPQQWQEGLQQPSPYSQRAVTPESGSESGRARDWRNSGWGRQQQNGSLGVTGAT
jgi:hypothetical protein